MKKIFILLFLFSSLFLDVIYASEFIDSHDTSSIIKAISDPITPEIIIKAREIDDEFMKTGIFGGQKSYLITDERSTRVNKILRKLLASIEQENKEWVVRVLDTNPPVVNAFITAGKYVYVFTGLLSEATSEDELAFILAHELGHSLLKHYERQKEDSTTNLATSVALIYGAIKKKHRDDAANMIQIMQSAYSRIDEQEADVFGGLIAYRAGYSPLRGADFFTRSSKKNDEIMLAINQELINSKNDYEQALANYNQFSNKIKSNPKIYNNAQNNNTLRNLYINLENKRVKYNNVITNSNNVKNQLNKSKYYISHPENQQRVAMIVALTDFLEKRRDIDSLKSFEQMQKVLLALQEIKSVVLLSPANNTNQKNNYISNTSENMPQKSNEKNLSQRLKNLEQAYKDGFISEEEYNIKRQKMLDEY